MNLQSIWLILRYEYWQNLRRRSFLFTAFGMPLLIFGAMFFSGQMSADSVNDMGDVERVAYLDEGGVLAALPPSLQAEFSIFVPYEDHALATADVQNGTLDGYILVPPDYLQSGRVEYFGKESPKFALEDHIGDFLAAGLAAYAGEDVPIERLQNPIGGENAKVQFLGEDRAVGEDALIFRFLIPLGFVTLLIISLITTTQFLMTGTVEEKENRIAELLLTSVRPSELMLGKLLGLGGLALTQIGYLLLLGLGGSLLFRQSDLLATLNLPASDIALALLYFVLSFVLYAAISLIIGASAAAEQESRQMAAVFTVVAIAPIYAVLFTLDNPQNLMVQVLSIFPLTAPTTNLLLMAVGEIQTWQLLLSLLVLLLTIALVLWMAARIFRRAMLMYDARLSLRQLRDIITGRL